MHRRTMLRAAFAASLAMGQLTLLGCPSAAPGDGQKAVTNQSEDSGASPAPSPSPRSHPLAFSLASGKLTTARHLHATAQHGKYVYVVGGTTSGSALKDIERAEIDSTGTMSNFSTLQGVSLQKARWGHSCHVIGNYLYVIGGVDGNTYYGDVERAELLADGSLGPFQVVPGVTLNTARQAHTSHVIGNYLYVIGGGTAFLSVANTVERAQINPDDTLGTFAVVPGVSLVENRFTHTSHLIGQYLYVVGGNSGGGGAIKSTERATVNGDGSIGTFATVPGAGLVTPRYDHSSQVVGNALYVIGGWSESGLKNSVEQAPVNTDGSIGAFATVQGLSQATGRIWATNLLVDNRLFIIGGSPDAVNSLSSVETLDF